MPNTGRPNKIDSLPVHIIGEIDGMLLSGEYTILSIVAYLEKEHGIHIDRETVSKYKKRLEEEYKDTYNDDKQEIIEPNSDKEPVQKAQVILNPKEVLQQLMNENFARVQEIRRMNYRRYDPKWESFINSYTDNIRKIIETLSKLDETFDNDVAKIDNMVKSHMAKLIKCAYETVKIICPEKLNDFKTIFSQKYKAETKQLENKNAEND